MNLFFTRRMRRGSRAFPCTLGDIREVATRLTHTGICNGVEYANLDRPTILFADDGTTPNHEKRAVFLVTSNSHVDPEGPDHTPMDLNNRYFDGQSVSIVCSSMNDYERQVVVRVFREVFADRVEGWHPYKDSRVRSLRV